MRLLGYGGRLYLGWGAAWLDGDVVGRRRLGYGFVLYGLLALGSALVQQVGEAAGNSGEHKQGAGHACLVLQPGGGSFGMGCGWSPCFGKKLCGCVLGGRWSLFHSRGSVLLRVSCWGACRLCSGLGLAALVVVPDAFDNQQRSKTGQCPGG